MRKQQEIYIDTTNEESLEQGAKKIHAMLSDLSACLAMRRERCCIICLEQEWMDPGEQICWKCGRCYEALKMLSRPLTQRSSPKHRALHDVVTWMQDVPEGQERSQQEIQNHFDELRGSYTWSTGKQCTKRDEYQNDVLNLLNLALYDMKLFFRRLSIVHEYYNKVTGDTARDSRQLTLWDITETE